MFNRILVPLDGSILAEKALPHAELLARIFGSTITLLHVLEPVSCEEDPKSLDPLTWQIRKAQTDLYLQGIKTRICENLGKQALKDINEKKILVNYTIREGKTAENIIDFAHSENFDLLIISTHGSSASHRWKISSITQKVINSVYLHVLLVRTNDQFSADETNIHYSRILLPIDSSRRAECVLPVGVALIRNEKSMRNTGQAESPKFELLLKEPQLILADILTPPEIPMPKPYPSKIGQLAEELMRVNRNAVHKYLEEIKQRLPVECETCLVEDQRVFSALEELVDEKDIDLVVLSAHGYNGHFIGPYGSVTRNYIEQGSRPVLILQDLPRSQVQPVRTQIKMKNPEGSWYVG